MACLLHPTYLPNMAHWLAMLNHDLVYYEVYDHYQKQSYRNRAEIYGANGKLILTVPVTYSQNNRQHSKDVRIFNDSQWQDQHLKSLEAAYSTSPFYEYYIDELMPLFKSSYTYLLDLNLAGIEILSEILEFSFSAKTTLNYVSNLDGLEDYRVLVKKHYKLNKIAAYEQVFSQKHGFMPNLSILDLIFNEGPAAESYLKALV